ncbi:MAG: hypothetical protein LUE24_12880 [Lachnospiraceae bacterium]|nr:hypothetical protein [Lachnospiraceae bacterium]
MKIILVSYSGSSASILRDRMLAWAHSNLMEAEVIVSSLAGLDGDRDDADIVLVGPQVRCALASVRERVPKKIPVLAVDTRDYGMAKGDRVMQDAIAAIKRYMED